MGISRGLRRWGDGVPRVLCALHAVSPRDLWCVLPSGQINVNVPRVLLPCHFRRAGSVCGSRANVCVNVNTTDATTGATALLLPAQNSVCVNVKS
jgi:hypothetical protein